MRILFINATDVSGGAAIIAQRLMKGLKQYHNAEYFFMVRFKKSSDATIKPTLSSFFQKAVERSMHSLTNLAGLQYLYFPFSSQTILKYAKEVKPDIISLHNTHGGYFATPLLKELSKIAPIVWTLHDMWSFTGNSAHTFGNESWKQLKNDAFLKKIDPAIGINTGAYLLKVKKMVYATSNLSIVTPSLWLKNLAVQSPVFEGKNITLIYNGIDDAIFKRKSKYECREKLQLPINEKIILFSAKDFSQKNPWKGGKDLLKILHEINTLTNEKLNLLILGEGEMKELQTFSNFNVYSKGYIKDEDTMSDCLNAADVFIYPTRADNLPNVLIESIACGTPCITFDIGGNNEIISDNYNGHIIDPFNYRAFALKCVELLNDKNTLASFSQNCIEVCANKFLLKDMAKNYYQLFSNIQLNYL